MDIDQFQRVSDLGRMQNLFRVTGQRHQVVAARLQTFKTLLRNSIDRLTQKSLSIQSFDQTNFFESRHPPAQGTYDRLKHLVGEQVAKLIKSDRPRVPHLKQNRHITSVGQSDVALVIPHETAPSLSRMRHSA